MKRIENKTMPIPLGDGLWQIPYDDNDRLMSKEMVSEKAEILFTGTCRYAVWKGVRSRMKRCDLDEHMPDYVCEALARYERIMWFYRPGLSHGEAKLIARVLQDRGFQIEPGRVGLKEMVYLFLSDCEMECPGICEAHGVEQHDLLVKIESMTVNEIFSLVHSVEAFRCGDQSDGHLEKCFNIEPSQDDNNSQGAGCDRQAVNP